jgi:hypothetical protein
MNFEKFNMQSFIVIKCFNMGAMQLQILEAPKIAHKN